MSRPQFTKSAHNDSQKIAAHALRRGEDDSGAAMLSHADRERLLDRLAELRDTDREMRQAGTLASPREPVPLHRTAAAGHVKLRRDLRPWTT